MDIDSEIVGKNFLYMLTKPEYSAWVKESFNKLSDAEKGEYDAHLDILNEYILWKRNTVQFDRQYVESAIETIKTMLDYHISARDIIFRFAFTSTLLRDDLMRAGLYRYIIE